MTSRVINDPSALGWEYDPDTGRWTWGGHSSLAVVAVVASARHQ